MSIGYRKMILKCILLIFLITENVQAGADDDLIKYTCNISGKIQTITGIPKEKILIKLTNGTFCHYSQTKCAENSKESPLHVIFQDDENTALYAGRSNKHYVLQCQPHVSGYDVVATASPINISPSTTFTPIAVTNTRPPLTMTLTSTTPSTNGDIYVGEELKLEMKSTGYNVYPQACTAINGDHTHDPEIPLWTFKSDTSDHPCSTFDHAVTIEKWTQKTSTNTVSIPIYAFRFMTSSKVIIKCTAHICHTTVDTCNQSSKLKTCMTTVAKRRRRSSGIVDTDNTISEPEEAFVSFSVVPENKAPNKANALSGHFTAVFTTIIFGRLFLRFV